MAFPTPQEIDGYWDWDKIHAPRPLTPLAGDAVVMSMGRGFTIAQHGFGSPLALHCRMVNNYFYSAFAPDEAYTPPTRDPDEYSRRLEALAFGIGERWTNEWEPSLAAILQKARAADFDAMSDTELLTAFAEQLDNNVSMWEMHGWINLSLIPATALTDFYNQQIQPADSNEGWQLLQGYRTKSVDAGSGLWQLSRMVKASPALTSLFDALDPRTIVAALEQSDEGRAFLEQLRAYLDDFGWRSDGIYEIAEATWREDPTIPLNTIQGYVRLGDEHDPARSLQRATERREELTRGAREKLAAEPDTLRRFDQLMAAARYNTRVTEDHSYWIDQMGTATLRRFCLSVGKRLTRRGAIDKPEDVFLLHTNEVHDALGGSANYRAQVRERAASLEASAQIVPPDHLGEPTPANPDPFFVALVDKMLGLLPVEPSMDPSIITGVAASQGTAQGKAKVVRSLVEASKLQRGDIMVCEMTVPTWVPLFATVVAVVADSGGVLSHCAIVAREFGLPAVVGTRVGTLLLQDGMTITVDGGRGIVRIDAR
jgi:pyruvate,water dikinase